MEFIKEPLLSKIIAEESNVVSPRREVYLERSQSRRQSATSLLTSDVIIPIVKTPNSASYVNLLANLNRKQRRLLRRSHSSPSVFTDVKESFLDSLDPRPPRKRIPSIVRQTVIGFTVYVTVFVILFLVSEGYKGKVTFKPVDALYYTVVTLCTIGYGDIVPDTTFTKLFTCVLILVGFGFIGILLNGLVTYICHRQEAILLSTVDDNVFNMMVHTHIIDKTKGRLRTQTKVFVALAVVVSCLATGTVMICLLEKLNWVDSFYLSVISVTTVGYGDYSFKTLPGRCFAIFWLLISTLVVARAFLCLTEIRMDRRSRRIANWVLQKKITLADLVAADLDNDGSISKSEYVIYKLKEMGKIAEIDISQICKQFESLDCSNSGKITLAGLMERD